MELRVLGAVEISAGGRVFATGRPQQGMVLAALIADAGRPVSVETLVDRVWEQAPPERARRMLHTHIARVRRVLEEAGAIGGEPASVTRQGGSYLLDVRPDCVDLHRFRDHVSRAGAPGRTAADRAVLLRAALDLWRGEPMAGLSGQWVEQTRHAWLQQRLHALVEWAHAELEAGDPLGVVERLTPELTEHPLVEPIAVALMRSLYAAGRGADALNCYAAVRRRLADELGTDPGPQLQAAHQAILRGEPGFATGPAVAAPRRRASLPPPAQLPADVAGFTGREDEVDRLDRLLIGIDTGAAVVISAVSGTAGVGKTALATHWAHRVREDFPDGQLYINLRGYDPDQPVTPDDALARFLAALGVAATDQPSGMDERAARYRTEVAGRRLLIVLDNASTVEQVRPLLPGTGPCAVLVTSRDSLAGLVAVHGAHRLDLDVLSVSEADALLRQQIGARADAEPQALAALIQRCARLPLALRVAAELAISRPWTPLADLADELADEQRRLDLLDAGGDPRAAVAAAFSWSLGHLPPETARTFRLLGLHPGPDVDSHAVAALAGVDLAQARHALTGLARAHLVQHTGRDRYGMHDLLRAYATSQANTQVPEADRKAAAGRLFDHYIAVAGAAADLLYPNEAPQRRESPAHATTVALSNPDDARQWLDTERDCLVAVAAHTATHGWPAHTLRLSATLARYLDGGYRDDAFTVHQHAYQAAQEVADLAGQAHAAQLLGNAYLGMRRPQSATEYHQRALALYRQTGDLDGEAAALNGLGRDEQVSGRYGQAIAYHGQAMSLLVRMGDHAGQARTLNKLGTVAFRQGRFQSAATHFRRAVVTNRRTGDQTGEALALSNLGLTLQRLDQCEAAAARLDEALSLCRRLGNVHGEASALDNLGAVHARLGRPRVAAEYHRKALALHTAIGEPDGQAWALNGLGEAAQLAGEPVESLAHHRAALDVATETGATDQQARAHTGLGNALRALGDPIQACRHFERALALYTGFDPAKAEQMRATLDETLLGADGRVSK